MTRYVLRRLGSGLLNLFLFVTLPFFLISIVLPGVTSSGPMSAEQSEAAREALGLNRPLYLPYVDWLRSVMTLDLGTSFGGPPVWET